MTKYILACLFCISVHPAWARSVAGDNFKIALLGGQGSSEIEMSSSSGNFTRQNYGLSLESHFSGGGEYSVGLTFLADQNIISNNSNTSSHKESFEGILFRPGARIYAASAFLGASVVAGNLTHKSEVSGTETSVSYFTMGLGVELGFEYSFGSSCFIAPAVNFEKMQMNASGNTQIMSSDFGARIALGFEF